MANENYYDILGVSKTATADQIKGAFRKLALEHHPDRGGGKAAEEKFKKINEAYQVLSDPKKRDQYDRFGQTFRGDGPSPFSGNADFGGFEFNFGGGLGDIFDSLFSQAFSQVQAQVNISPAQAVVGDKLKLSIANESVELTIPAGTAEGTQFVLRGKGREHRGGRGDVILTVHIDVPRRLSRREKELWEELKKLSR